MVVQLTVLQIRWPFGFSVVSNGYYGIPKGQIHNNLPSGNPITSFETTEIKVAAVYPKRSMESGRN